MQQDDDTMGSKLGMSGLLHTLARLVEEASTLNMPLTGSAIRNALLLCATEHGPALAGDHRAEAPDPFTHPMGLLH